ncbi:mannose-1-phosphate guanylyltransferase [Rubritalea marina]|uniref:mannose-1-phosphate guanylyltransferase n=1 Tax=Rubritalea marina TaxID=361055 RepID=UPI00036B1E4B|nr:sugar phosphate nucleotidyltransferase [Rubritalea marina]
MTNNHSYALILAGGSGTRFWPLSRDAKPKQLLNLLGEKTLLEQTIERLEGFVPNENIIILTNEIQLELVREVAHTLPTENIYAEPAKRDTGPAIALGAGIIAARDPEATMVVLPADHMIEDTENFQQVLSDAMAVASESPSLVTIGIKPTWPCPSYGYIERAGPSPLTPAGIKNFPHEVTCFREKPDTLLAERFLKRGNFAWNAGMFIWSIPTLKHELAAHCPELASFVDKFENTDCIESLIQNDFDRLTPISIDYALMEKAAHVLNIQANFDWDDVGSWLSVAKYLDDSEEENKTNSPLVQIDSSNNIIFTEDKKTQVALLGVDDLIVVQTGDSLLVANKHQADEIKKLVGKLPEELH